MKPNPFIHHVIRLVALLTIAAGIESAHAQGTAFTYQGRLVDAGSPANGSYDLTFALFSVSSGAGQIGNTVTNSATTVSNGMFTARLDFGANFPGAARWLEIAVRTNGNGGFATLTPRQPLTPSPYAITAGNLNGTVSGSGLSGTYASSVTFNNAGNSFSGNGAGLANVNAATVGGLSASGFWQTGGNAGTSPGANFIGTTDNQPFEVKVNGGRALRLEPSIINTNYLGIVNVIGGSPANFVAPTANGATISGGGAAGYFGALSSNSVAADFGAIGGGLLNTTGDFAATVSGGRNNKATGPESTIGGGSGNSAPNDFTTVAGGQDNQASGPNSTVGGGIVNIASGDEATVPGGEFCTAAGSGSFAAGTQAKANHDGTFVWADSHSTDFASTASDQFLIRASGGVGIGTAAPETPLHVAGAAGITLGVSATGGGNTALRIDLSAVQNGYAELQAIKQSGTSFGNLILETVGGNVGIGKNNPATALDVNGTVTATAFNPSSDRNLKENFTPVSPRDVLNKVVGIPITRWNFISDPETAHVGPMAQDFRAAFGLGTDERHIATVDADGVALAAIQGLNQKLEEQRAENAELKQRLEKLERLMDQRNGEPK